MQYKIEVGPSIFPVSIEEYFFIEEDWSDEAKRAFIKRIFATVEKQFLGNIGLGVDSKPVSEAVEEYDNPRLTRRRNVL